jgi:hypothetical protein
MPKGIIDDENKESLAVITVAHGIIILVTGSLISYRGLTYGGPSPLFVGSELCWKIPI